MEEAKWYFFYLAGEHRAIALGREGLGTLRRAVKQILAKQEGQTFNSLEITKVASKRFLGFPFMSVAAHFRHIQQGICLVPAKNSVLRMLNFRVEWRRGRMSRSSEQKAIRGSVYKFLGIVWQI